MNSADDLAESQRACTRFVEGQLLQGTDLLNLVLIADSAPDAELVDDAEENPGSRTPGSAWGPACPWRLHAITAALAAGEPPQHVMAEHWLEQWHSVCLQWLCCQTMAP